MRDGRASEIEGVIMLFSLKVFLGHIAVSIDVKRGIYVHICLWKTGTCTAHVFGIFFDDDQLL